VNEAAVILQQAVRLRAAPDSHNNLGLALAEQGKFADAEANYHQTLRLNTNYADAHSTLGLSLIELTAKVNGAFQDFESAEEGLDDGRQLSTQVARFLVRGAKAKAIRSIFRLKSLNIGAIIPHAENHHTFLSRDDPNPMIPRPPVAN
jgi:tetratricopeptide (TPR) repeat protein